MEFEWDKGNSNKNLKSHGISDQVAEEPFLDKHKVQKTDEKHSAIEGRFILLGKTRQGDVLYVVYTFRRNKIRIISARKTNGKERLLYEKATRNA